MFEKPWKLASIEPHYYEIQDAKGNKIFTYSTDDCAKDLEEIEKEMLHELVEAFNTHGKYYISLLKINDIRNMIVGHQNVNWSRDIYPLVAALNEAGIKGIDFNEMQMRTRNLQEALDTRVQMERIKAIKAAFAHVGYSKQYDYDNAITKLAVELAKEEEES